MNKEQNKNNRNHIPSKIAKVLISTIPIINGYYFNSPFQSLTNQVFAGTNIAQGKINLNKPQQLPSRGRVVIPEPGSSNLEVQRSIEGGEVKTTKIPLYPPADFRELMEKYVYRPAQVNLPSVAQVPSDYLVSFFLAQLREGISKSHSEKLIKVIETLSRNGYFVDGNLKYLLPMLALSLPESEINGKTAGDSFEVVNSSAIVEILREILSGIVGISEPSSSFVPHTNRESFLSFNGEKYREWINVVLKLVARTNKSSGANAARDSLLKIALSYYSVLFQIYLPYLEAINAVNDTIYGKFNSFDKFGRVLERISSNQFLPPKLIEHLLTQKNSAAALLRQLQESIKYIEKLNRIVAPILTYFTLEVLKDIYTLKYPALKSKLENHNLKKLKQAFEHTLINDAVKVLENPHIPDSGLTLNPEKITKLTLIYIVKIPSMLHKFKPVDMTLPSGLFTTGGVQGKQSQDFPHIFFDTPNPSFSEESFSSEVPKLLKKYYKRAFQDSGWLVKFGRD